MLFGLCAPKLGFCGTIRRECIYAFHPGRKLLGLLNRKNVVVCVGNGFRPSERSVNIRGSLVGNGFQFFPTMIHSTYLDKNVAEAECINAFPTQNSSLYDLSNPGGE